MTHTSTAQRSKGGGSHTGGSLGHATISPSDAHHVPFGHRLLPFSLLRDFGGLHSRWRRAQTMFEVFESLAQIFFGSEIAGSWTPWLMAGLQTVYLSVLERHRYPGRPALFLRHLAMCELGLIITDNLGYLFGNFHPVRSVAWLNLVMFSFLALATQDHWQLPYLPRRLPPNVVCYAHLLFAFIYVGGRALLGIIWGYICWVTLVPKLDDNALI